MTATSAVPDRGVWRPEWWERLSGAAARWRRRHPRARRVLLVVRIAWIVAGLGWLIACAIGFRELRPSAGVVVGCLWLALVWFVLARTKTLSWEGYTWLLSLAVPWSYLAGLLSWSLSDHLGGTTAARVVVGFAPVFEESVKLVPLAVLAIVAPRRVQRFAVSDWLLVGFASGLGFTLAEEVTRRASWVVGGGEAHGH